MMTTDNEIVHDDDPAEEAKILHRNETGNLPSADDNPTQQQINDATGTNPVLDAPDQHALDAVDNDTRNPVDGNGLREHDDEDVAKDDAVVKHATQAQQDIAKREQDRQNAKLNQNTRPGQASSEDS